MAIGSICAAPLLLCCLIASAVAADTARGKRLHDSECLACHASTQYTRANRKVDSLDRLRARVAYCRDDVGAEWDAADTEDVVRYLNTFYAF